MYSVYEVVLFKHRLFIWSQVYVNLIVTFSPEVRHEWAIKTEDRQKSSEWDIKTVDRQKSSEWDIKTVDTKVFRMRH